MLFIAVGILGFFPNPIIGMSPEVIFHADTMHNMVHIVSGVLFLLVALSATGRSGFFLRAFGVVYLSLGIIGFISMGNEQTTQVAGFLHVNKADNYLHIGLGIIIFLAGLLSKKTVRLSATSFRK